MADVMRLIGSSLPAINVKVEQGPASVFAKACKDENPIYQSLDAAREAGFDRLPVSPTFPFVVQSWGAFPDIQPDPDTAAGGINAVIAELMAGGGLILHGEQEFVYHRPVLVGDTLYGTGRIADITTKEGGGGATMTIIKAVTDYCDEAGSPLVTMTMTLIHRSKPPTAS